MRRNEEERTFAGDLVGHRWSSWGLILDRRIVVFLKVDSDKGVLGQSPCIRSYSGVVNVSLVFGVKGEDIPISF